MYPGIELVICVGSPKSRPVVPPVGRLRDPPGAAAQHSPMTWRRWVAVRGHRADRRRRAGFSVGLTHQHPTGAGTTAQRVHVVIELCAGVIMWARRAAGAAAGSPAAFVASTDRLCDCGCAVRRGPAPRSFDAVVIWRGLAIWWRRSASGPRRDRMQSPLKPDIVFSRQRIARTWRGRCGPQAVPQPGGCP